MHASTKYFLGIDGGGTQSRGVVIAAEPCWSQRIAEFSGQATNPLRVGWETATANLKQTVEGTLTAAGLRSDDICRCCCALSGAGVPERARRFEQFLVATLSFERNQLLVTHDAEPLLGVGTDAGAGVALISGTGSIAWGRDGRGGAVRGGGWGPELGDEGSGPWIGRAALAFVTQVYDQRCPKSPLFDLLVEELPIESEAWLRQQLGQPDWLSQTLPRIPALVVRRCEQGDTVAIGIIRRAAVELAELVQAVVSRLPDLSTGYQLVVSGSLLTQSKTVRDSCLVELENRRCRPTVVRLVSDPAAAAAALAAVS